MCHKDVVGNRISDDNIGISQINVGDSIMNNLVELAKLLLGARRGGGKGSGPIDENQTQEVQIRRDQVGNV